MVKNLTAMQEIPGLGRSPGKGTGYPLHYSCLENSMDRGAWQPTVHGVSKSQTRLSDFTFTFHFHAWEKEMATHSSVLAWRIPWMEKPGRLQSMGLQSWTRLKRLSSRSSSSVVLSLLWSRSRPEDGNTDFLLANPHCSSVRQKISLEKPLFPRRVAKPTKNNDFSKSSFSQNGNLMSRGKCSIFTRLHKN